MTTFVALLRAVNVGGNNKLPMSTLRASLETAGFDDVVTYIQSGNVVLKAPERSSEVVARRVEAAITAQIGITIDVLIRSAKELASVIKANPYVGRVPDVTKLHVLFLDRKPNTAALDALAQKPFEPDEFTAGRSEVYLHCPDGVGRSKLVIAIGPKLAPAVATMRNWNTVTKLAQMARS
jgi:uncharacterized protein (DUF1697 family)